ncbi:MAG: fibronectin type III domain-containing protein [bacterium]|nr:fibronectin type III domain-containing protein [bacterium]
MTKILIGTGLLALGVVTVMTFTEARGAHAADATIAGPPEPARQAATQPVEATRTVSEPTTSKPMVAEPLAVEPIRPYVLALTRDSATLCWVTAAELVGSVRLFSYSEETLHEETGAASHFHKVAITGLQPATTYRYEIGLNYRGTFTTASRSPAFEVAVFGHPGGTERPLEYPTEMLQGRLLAIQPELVLCTGDITFKATLRDFRKAFFERFGEFMSSRPIYVSPANHECRGGRENYELFRKLFPYDFGPKTGGSHWFDYKQARFFAFTYRHHTPAEFQKHLSWLTDALDNSNAEFNIVFLGGADRTYYDRDALFRTLSKHRVELVLGGDGGGTKQEKLHGLDFFFSGDGDMGAYPFYYLRFHAHHFDVQLHYSDTSRRSVNFRSFYSKKPRRVQQHLASKQQESEAWRLVYRGIDTPSTAVAGVHLTIDWDESEDVELQMLVGGKGRGLEKEQCHLVKANTKTEVLIDIPEANPVDTDGVPYEINRLILQLAPHRPRARHYALQDKISNVYLFTK